MASDGGDVVADVEDGFLSVEHDRVTIVAEAVDASSIRA